MPTYIALLRAVNVGGTGKPPMAEIYVSYGAGMGRSKLKIPAAVKGTARNIYTIAKLVELARNN